MFQREEHENSEVYTGNYTWFSFVEGQSVRKEVVREEIGEIREAWL